MIKIDENALICDLAETYRIYNYREIAPSMIAIFSIGLRDDSRIKMKLSNQKVDYKTLLLAMIFDKTNLLLWSKTKDAQNGANKPVSLSESLLNIKTTSNISAFTSGKEFEKAKARILSGKEDKYGD